MQSKFNLATLFHLLEIQYKTLNYQSANNCPKLKTNDLKQMDFGCSLNSGRIKQHEHIGNHDFKEITASLGQWTLLFLNVSGCEG